MRIHLYGNVLNWGYQFGGYLRALGHDVRLFLDAGESTALYRPEWERDGATAASQDWIEMVDVQFRRLLVPGREERRLIARLGDCDVIQTFGEYAMWAWRTETPYVTLSYGGDVSVIPFARGSLKQRLVGQLMTHAFRAADAVVCAMPSHRVLFEQLKVRPLIFNPHAVPIDTDRCAPAPADERRRLRAQFSNDLVFFHGARQEWTFNDANDKGNDRLFRAFARFVHGDGADALLVAVERGRDIGPSKALVSELGITDHVRWVQELDRPRLVAMLNSADVFFDQFVNGCFGVVTLEALSCGTPTCLRLDPVDGMDMPPVLDGSSEDAILEAMRVSARPERRAQLAQASRDWTVAHHDWRVVMEWYVRLYHDVLERRATAA